jgi:DNA-binding transcriptional LysR family regulator
MVLTAEGVRFHRHAYPKVRFNITESLMPAEEGALRDGSLDFYPGAATSQNPAPGLAVQHLCDNTRMVVCRKGHPRARARSLKSLAGAERPSTTIDHNAEKDLVRLYASHGQSAPRVMLSAHSALSVQVALVRSDLLAILLRQWMDFAMTRDLHDVIPVRERLPAPAIVMVRQPDLPLSPPAELFCATFRMFDAIWPDRGCHDPGSVSGDMPSFS